MKLKKVNFELIEEMKKRLEFLEYESFENVCESPTFPYLHSSVPGTTQFQSTPTWYTKIHDIIEELIVSYSEEDIEDERFLEMKIDIEKHTLIVTLHDSDTKVKLISLMLDIHAKDEIKGTFYFKDDVLKELAVYRNIAKLVA